MVLGGEVLAPEEAKELIASPAAASGSGLRIPSRGTSR